MNLPNSISLTRMALAIPFMALLEFHGYEHAATAIFTFAALTDWLDGYLARKLNQVSDLGKLLDPLVDKILVTAALVALVSRGTVPAWSVSIVLFREFVVTGLRAVEAQRGVALAAGWSGKVKAFLQMVALVGLLWSLNPSLLPPYWLQLSYTLYWASVATAIYSGVEYVFKARKLFTSQ